MYLNLRRVHRVTPQQKWDVFLITSFYKRPNVYMWQAIGIFNQDVEGLLRTPVLAHQKYSTVMVFVCNCLPSSLGDHLWTKEITDAYEIALKLPQDSFGTLTKYYGKGTREERDEAAALRKKYRACRIAQESELDFVEKFNRTRHKGCL